MFREIVEELKQTVNGRMVMTPAELQTIMGLSVNQQANMRSQNRFPINHQKVGSKVLYTVHAVAKHLSASATDSVKETIKEIERDKPLSRSKKKNMTNHLKSGWWCAYCIELRRVCESNNTVVVLSSAEVMPEIEDSETSKKTIIL